MVKDGKMSSLREEVGQRMYIPGRSPPEIGQVAFYVRTFNAPGPMIQTLRRETSDGVSGTGVL